MRIITGTARGRKLSAPEGHGTRPVLDAQKEMLFSVLGGRAAASLVYDLFAGSGGLGLEALSRGAAAATFFERDREALACLRANIDHCGFRDRARVVPIDAFRIALSDPANPAALVFVDPPFPCFDRERPRLENLLAKLASGAAIATGAIIVWRVPERVVDVVPPAALVEVDRRESGKSTFVLYEKRAAP